MEQQIQSSEDSSLAFNEVQLILAEKRTALSTMRTGISVFVLPLSVLSVLVATSRYYEIPRCYTSSFHYSSYVPVWSCLALT